VGRADRGHQILGQGVNELKTRGCHEILISVVDGVKGLAEAIGAAYPRAAVQTCIVQLIRNSLEYASNKDRKVVAQALRPIYTVASEEDAKQALRKRRFQRMSWWFSGNGRSSVAASRRSESSGDVGVDATEVSQGRL
jgi:transposase-like protein